MYRSSSSSRYPNQRNGFPSAFDDPYIRSAFPSDPLPSGSSRGLAFIMASFSRFVPQMEDKFLRSVCKLYLTHPPVVFGPHRSPRDEGHLFLQADSSRHRATRRVAPLQHLGHHRLRHGA